MPDRAVNIADNAALAAHDVVVVIAYARFVASDMTVRLNSTHKACCGERLEHVVNGLMRDLSEFDARGLDDRVGIGMGMCVDRGEHGQAGLGDAQVDIAELLCEVDSHKFDRRPVS